jgi:hypothetical protein
MSGVRHSRDLHPGDELTGRTLVGFDFVIQLLCPAASDVMAEIRCDLEQRIALLSSIGKSVRSLFGTWVWENFDAQNIFFAFGFVILGQPRVKFMSLSPYDGIKRRIECRRFWKTVTSMEYPLSSYARQQAERKAGNHFLHLPMD